MIKYKHVQSIEKDGKVIAAKITVYAGKDEQYPNEISKILQASLSIKPYL